MKHILTTLTLLLCMWGTAFAGVIYVDAAATGSNNGTSWTDAYTDLQTAITAAVDGDELWVKKGIYRPTKDKTGSTPMFAQQKTFYVNKNISIHGGFSGGETSLAGRGTLTLPTNILGTTAADVTILSGDLSNNEGDINFSANNYAATPSLAADNAFTVLHIGTSVTNPLLAQFTGLTITAGVASTTISNLEDTRGGGVYNEGVLNMSQCFVVGNSAVTGGNIYTKSSATVTATLIFGGGATNGGALYSDNATVNCVSVGFLSNGATNGGAVYNVAASGTPSVGFVNCVFNSNGSFSGNGAVFYNKSDGGSLVFNLINSTCVFAVATSGNGGVIYSDGTAGLVSNNIYNSILYGNTATNYDMFAQTGSFSSVNLYHSLIQGANATAESSGTVVADAGVIYGKDPQFVNFNTSLPTSSDLTLKTSSPCINAGDNTILNTLSITTDGQGGTRFYCDVTDLGAFERSNGKGLLTRSQAISLNGSSDYVDIGSVISNFNAARDFTVEGWVKVTAFDAGATVETVLSNRSGTNGANFGIAGAADASNAGKLVLKIGNSQSIYSSGTIALGEWTHVAATFEQNGAGTNVVKFYINGHEDATFSAANNIATSTANTLIGYETASTDAINAALDEVRIWTTTRTTAEIRENMRLLHPCGAEGVLATYQFNSNTNNALELGSDAAGDYAGTAVGAPTYVTSTMPLSAGRAATFNVTGAGTHSLTGINSTSLDVTFGGTNVPNGNIVVSYLNQAASGNPLNTGLSSLNNVQYVIDNYGNDTTNLAFTLKFNAGDGASLGDAASNYKLEKRWYNTDGAWTNAKIAADALSNTTGSKSISFNLTNASFGQFLPTKGNLLPVEMTTFTATLEGAAVVLDWQTATEENNAGFEVNRSTDGKTWKKIGFVEGNGTVYNAQNYQFRDAAPKTGVNYYRLRQVDFDGAFAFSDVRSVLVSGKTAAISFAPNPTEGNLWINLAEVNETATVQVYDLTGRLLINEIADAKNPQFVLDLSALDNGLYIVQVKGANWQTTEKVLVKH